MATAATAAANEASCTNAAAANGYVTGGRYLEQIQQDCAVAYNISSAGGGGPAALAAANQYLRSLGYHAATVEQMDIAGHGT